MASRPVPHRRAPTTPPPPYSRQQPPLVRSQSYHPPQAPPVYHHPNTQTRVASYHGAPSTYGRSGDRSCCHASAQPTYTYHPCHVAPPPPQCYPGYSPMMSPQYSSGPPAGYQYPTVTYIDLNQQRQRPSQTYHPGGGQYPRQHVSSPGKPVPAMTEK